VDESRAINEVKHAIVLAGSGMLNGGRIVHHLKHSIWDRNNHVIIVGYQAHGTLGRRIVEGAKIARIAGEEVNVRAQIHTVNGFSAHADRDDLLTWAANFTTNPFFFVTHGEERSSAALVNAMKEKGLGAVAPAPSQEFDLLELRQEEVPERKVIPVQPAREESELNEILSDISFIAENIRLKLNGTEDMDELRSLLISGKTLLETAEDRIVTKE
jgi:metallo-beta-lactamase family protein